MMLTASTAAVTLPALTRPASVSLLSPYRRPMVLQPRRVLAELCVLFGTTTTALAGLPPYGTLGIDIEIKDAGRRGKGLFALRDFDRGQIVGRYSGVVASIAEFREARNAGLTTGDYLARAAPIGSIVIDSERSDGNGPGRYVNHSKLWVNCEIVGATLDVGGETVPTGAVYVITTKAVKVGSEFFVDYGEGYWSRTYEKSNGPLEEAIQRISIDYWP